MFKKIGLAITFSPTGKALLEEAGRLKNLFKAELILIHAGEKNSDTEKKLHDLVINCGLLLEEVTFVWVDGKPAKVIINSIKQNGIELLIAGALEKEKAIKYYFGSVARKLMREAPCSLLILTSSVNANKQFKKIAVSVDFSSVSENTVVKAHQFAILEKSEKLIVIREIDITGLSASVSSSSSVSDFELFREKLVNEESAKMNMFLSELNLQGIDIEKVCLSGKEGWEAKKFLKDNNVDLFVFTAPIRRLGIFDRVFQHDLEFIFMDIPCDLFIIERGKK